MIATPSGTRESVAWNLGIETGTSLEWTLRVGAFLCFLGHGAFGIMTKEAWVPLFSAANIGSDTAFRLMPLIGTADILLASLALVQPRAALLLYMTIWAIWTAALRPLSGMPVWEMLERGGNYGVPLSLLLLAEVSREWRSWLKPAEMRSLSRSLLLRLRLALAITTALLLVGHGALAIQQKPEIVSHYALLQLPVAASLLAQASGWLEIVVAGVVLWRPTVGLCVVVLVWKLATESLFLFAGAPVWEVVERGGSYAAPLALAFVLQHTKKYSGRLAEILTPPRWAGTGQSLSSLIRRVLGLDQNYAVRSPNSVERRG